MNDFVDTCDHLTFSDNSYTFSLYAQVFAAGSVTLGGNYGEVSSSMYTVVVAEQ